jgi:hypothetical protein
LMPLNGDSRPNLASERHRLFFLAAGIVSSSLHLPSRSPWLVPCRGGFGGGATSISFFGHWIWYGRFPSICTCFTPRLLYSIHFRFPQAGWTLCT